jgi:outer membrane receptor protein involved in Fe transport
MSPQEAVELLRRTGCVVAVVSSSVANAQEGVAQPITLERVVVNGGRSANLIGVADSATEGTIDAKQLATRPLLRPAEVLESVPGLTVTQHSGDGKANQYFLRGFNLDHGSDFASYVNGMPINNVSHAHGQGYMDLNFLIPELISTVRYRKGTYNAEDNAFAVTGVAYVDYARSLPEAIADVTLGQHNYRRALGAGSVKLSDEFTLLGGIELAGTDGPWEQPEKLHKVNTTLRLSSGTAANGFSATAMTYVSRWIATEHVPERAIASGEIGRYGTLAPTDGGQTYRHSLSADWARSGDAGSTRANGYVVGYGLNLFSSPSGVQDPQHEQEDRRTIYGGAVSHSTGLGAALYDTEATLGLQYRRDRIPRVGLFNTVDRVRTETVRQDKIDQSAIGLYAEARTQWSPWFRSTLGARFDWLRGTVSSIDGPFNAANGGAVRATQASPKVALAFGPFSGAEFYVNWGRGFHTNDFRGATSSISPVDGSPVEKVHPLAKATSTEVGVRARPLPGWNTALSLWKTDLASELVFIGDEGVTEPKGASRRSGIEWWNDYAPTSWLTIDADLAISRARFVEASNGGTQVPNAIPLSASLGVSADANGAWFGGLRLRYIGAYPLEETGTRKSTAFLTTNLKVGYRINPSVRVSVDVLNLFDRQANDIEYWGTSCTRAEGAGCNGGDGFDGKLVHPLEPRTLRVSVRANF